MGANHFHTHGMSRTSTYHIWRSMLARCLNPKRKDYPRYGGRGIAVAASWRGFEGFFADMGTRPEGLTLERVDPDGDYCKENCVWASYKEQARNKTNNVIVSFNGTTACVAEWAEKTGLERKTLEYRIRNGWSAESALTTPSLIDRKPKCRST